MELKIKSIDMPQVWEEGSSASVHLYMIISNEVVGRMSVTIPFSDDFTNMPISAIAENAITQAKNMLS